MGTTAHMIVTGGPSGLADRAVARLEQLEARWSRFRPDSEISRLNEHADVPVLVSEDTYRLIELALEGWRLTDGRFDPTLLREVRAAGLRPVLRAHQLRLGQGRRRMRAARASRLRRDPGAEQIRLDPIVGTVLLGRDVEVDPGGIGKGLAADLVVELLLAEGASGALVNVGGDLRVSGDAPEGEGWIVAINDPNHADQVVGTLALDAGAVASSWRTKRAWTAPDGTRRHHLIDPATDGRPTVGSQASPSSPARAGGPRCSQRPRSSRAGRRCRVAHRQRCVRAPGRRRRNGARGRRMGAVPRLSLRQLAFRDGQAASTSSWSWPVGRSSSPARTR